MFGASEMNGMTEESTTPIVYVDANPFIYFIDGDENIARRLKPFFEFLSERPGFAVTSELTLAEVLAKARPEARRNYFNLILWSNLFLLRPVTREILIDTADYRRASQRERPDGTTATVKLPDAIHCGDGDQGALSGVSLCRRRVEVARRNRALWRRSNRDC